MADYLNQLTINFFRPMRPALALRSHAMLEPVLTAPIFAVHGLLDGARGKGLATPEWLVGVLGRAGISESLLELEESRVTVEQFNALFIAVRTA